MRRISLLSMAIGVVFVAAACGGAGPTANPSPTAGPTAKSNGTAAPTANPDLTPAPKPAGWQYLSWSDPALEIALPGDWATGNPSQTTDPASIQSLTPNGSKVIAWSNGMASSGKIRLLAAGKVVTQSGSVDGGSLAVYVESGDSSLNAFADRAVQLNWNLGVQTLDRSTVVLPAGPAVRLAYSGLNVDASGDFTEVDYLFLLPDGRSLTVGFSGNDQAAVPSMVSDFANTAIATLRPATGG